MSAQTVRLEPSRRWLATLGDWLRDHATALRWMQWAVVVVYAVLLIVPTWLPLPDETAHVWNNLTVVAQFAFWGVWWPFVLLSMVLFGRLWCGVLCPEGALTEWAARRGRGRPIPRWMRWGGWPFVAFVCTTVYGQMVSVYQYPQAALVVLGGSTVAAVVVGWYYTKGKRAWCRYLCPVNGVFALLAKLAPVHFHVDKARWQHTADGKKVFAIKAVDCAPLQPIKQMQGGSGCHMCGRCSGHQDAVTLRWRSPSDEVVRVAAKEADVWQTLLIVFGLMGVAVGAFHWSASPWFISLKQGLAEWLVEHDHFRPLDTDAPWWLFTHYPEVNDVFSWLDGGLLVAYILVTGLVLGLVSTALLALAVRASGHWQGRRLHHLAQALIPLAGCGVFLGLSAVTVSLLRGEGVPIFWVSDLRLVLLIGANVWSLRLAQAIVRQWQPGWRTLWPLLPFAGLMLWVDAAWGLLFWWW